VTALIEEAIELLEEDLVRPLAAIERTETMYPDRAGWLWPTALPIQVAEDWTIDGHALRGGSWPASDLLTGCQSSLSVTYTGGYVERTANPDAANRLPLCIERDIAWAAYALGNPDAVLSSLPAGANAVSVGDISISFAGGVSGSGDDLRIQWSRRTLRYRRRSV
jgi:hypothetical protein